MATFLKNAPRSILWFKQIHERGELEMKPPFQRNPVWTEKQKSYLIDSILNEYPVPEIYMQEIVSEAGEIKYVIVDGQQRIRACLEFVSNEFEIDGKDSPQWAGLTFEELKPEEKKRIYGYDFIARYLPDIPDTEIRTIFQRLNRNTVALNPQELRQATYWGYFITTMNEIAEFENWSKLGVFTANDVKRMLDVEFISELSIAVLHGHQNKKQTIDKYYALYETEFDQSSHLKEVFDSVLRELVAILPNIQQTKRWYKKSDFYSLFVVFAKRKELLPLSVKGREAAILMLNKFALEIDAGTQIQKGEGEGESELIETPTKLDADAQKYLNAVIRAASDLGSRKRRDEALEAKLSAIWTDGFADVKN